jgi:hypothetical protein
VNAAHLVKPVSVLILLHCVAIRARLPLIV